MNPLSKELWTIIYEIARNTLVDKQPDLWKFIDTNNRQQRIHAITKFICAENIEKAIVRYCKGSNYEFISYKELWETAQDPNHLLDSTIGDLILKISGIFTMYIDIKNSDSRDLPGCISKKSLLSFGGYYWCYNEFGTAVYIIDANYLKNQFAIVPEYVKGFDLLNIIIQAETEGYGISVTI